MFYLQGEMEVTPAGFAQFVNLLSPLADGKLCLVLEVRSY
jgi:hypothetical protein